VNNLSVCLPAGEHGRIEGIHVQGSNWSTVAWQKQAALSEL
jgi:hypothetical protein